MRRPPLRPPLRIAILALPLALGACVGGFSPTESVARVGVGQIAPLGTMRLVPLQVVEDSRCPANAQCDSPGRFRLRVSVEPAFSPHQRTLTLGRPELISGGTLVLEDARPLPADGRRLRSGDYRFTFRFTQPRIH